MSCSAMKHTRTTLSHRNSCAQGSRPGAHAQELGGVLVTGPNGAGEKGEKDQGPAGQPGSTALRHAVLPEGGQVEFRATKRL